MNPDEKDLIKETYDLEKENNRLLKNLRNTNRWTVFFRVVYWTVIIGVAVGAFYYIQPYVNNILSAYENVQNDLMNVKSVVNKVSNKSN